MKIILCFQVLLIAVTGINDWKTCCVTTFSTEFQSYQDDEWVIIKGCLQWNPVYYIYDLFLRKGQPHSH